MSRINLVPVGNIERGILDFLVLRLKETFNLEIDLAPKLEEPSYAYSPERKQYHSGVILSRIKELELPGKSLGLVNVDLFAPGLNFVFGQAEPGGKVAVISICRLRPEFYGLSSDLKLLEERTIKEAIHELGHLYKLGHCPEPECVMYFSNSLKDTDIKRAEFCPRCWEKVKR